MSLKIFYPFKPFTITQRWGNPNGQYASHFGDSTFKLHNGIDAVGKRTIDYKTGLTKAEYPVYCPVDNFYVAKVDYEPNGGGHEVLLASNDPLEVFEKTCYIRIFLCHAKKILVKAGDQLKLGELIMIADNTGFSTGLHTHIGVYRTDVFGNKLDTNEATGSFDPSLFFNDQYAIDHATLPTLIKSNMRYYKYVLGL